MLWCESDATKRRGAGAGTGQDEARDRRRGRALRCIRCRAEVTTTDARIEVGGRHEHACMNMHGYFHHFGCFAAAPGCVAVGVPTSEWTWFPGHSWQLANCRRCGLHLGWRFTSGDSGFHGLLLERLVESTGDDGEGGEGGGGGA